MKGRTAFIRAYGNNMAALIGSGSLGASAATRLHVDVDMGRAYTEGLARAYEFDLAFALNDPVRRKDLAREAHAAVSRALQHYPAT